MPANGHAGIIMFSATFFLFFFAISQMGGPSIVGEVPQEVQEPPFDSGACDIGGFDALVDIAVCAVDIGQFFFNLIITDTPFFLLKYGFLIPLGITILFIIAVVIRGGGG